MAQRPGPGVGGFEAVTVGIDGDCDVVLIDTAGRLHRLVSWTNSGKVKRVIEKKAPVSEVLLCSDANNGPERSGSGEGVRGEAVDITGVV